MPPGVIEMKLVVASNRLVGCRPNPQQLEACMSILQGKDMLISLLTGYSYGKTFVYQLLPSASTEIMRSCFLLAGDKPVLLKAASYS